MATEDHLQRGFTCRSCGEHREDVGGFRGKGPGFVCATCVDAGLLDILPEPEPVFPAKSREGLTRQFLDGEFSLSEYRELFNEAPADD